MKKIPYIIIILFALSSCKDVFDPPPQSLLEITIIYSNQEEVDSVAISAYGLDKDSMIIFQEITDMFRLPLSRQDSSSFIIVFDSIQDTLLIKHDTKLVYESVETGFFTEHWINHIEHSFNRIDSVVIVDSTVNQFWHENIQLHINNLPLSIN